MDSVTMIDTQNVSVCGGRKGGGGDPTIIAS